MQAIGSAEIPLGEQHGSGLSEKWTIEYEAELSQAIVVVPDSEPGQRELTGQFGYQVCDKSGCKPFKSVRFALPFEVQAGEPRAEHRATEEELGVATAAADAGADADAGSAAGSGATGNGAAGNEGETDNGDTTGAYELRTSTHSS